MLRAERLFAGRDNLESLTQAVSLLEELRSRNPSNYEVLWRLAKYKYYLSDREKDEAKRVKILEAGIEAAKKAIQLDGGRPEGHFWLGANDGEYADLKGAFSSLSLIKTIRREFETVLSIDPGYENGAVYLALGQMDIESPRLLGGSNRRGIETLEKGLKVAPNNAELRLVLGENYAKTGRKDEAKRLLESVLSANDPTRTSVELEGIKAKARKLLDKMK